MRQLLDSNLDLVIESGFIYVPLLFDATIEREIQTLFGLTSPQEVRRPRKTKTVIEVDGRHFVKSLSLRALLENYEKIHPDSYEQLRCACLQKYCHSPDLSATSIDGKLRTIVFQVLPHFIKRRKGLERRRLTDEEILDLASEKINIPPRCYEHATKFLDREPLRRILNDLEKLGRTTIEPLEDGLISARELREFVNRALEVRVLDSEKGHLRQALHRRGQSAERGKKYIAILMYIAEKGFLEIDGFGFCRIGSSDEYLVYKHTGEYALKDYSGIYLFPDCRVAVWTTGSLMPVVLERYKHPFLRRHASGQAICLPHFRPARVFTAQNVINALEEGINMLFYGYSARRRSGYHTLCDETLLPRPVDFDDYCVSRNHPKIASGQIEIKNDFT